MTIESEFIPSIMCNDTDPYCSPSNAGTGVSSFERFEGWTTLRLLLLFFLPSFLLLAFFLIPTGLEWLGVKIPYSFIDPLILPLVVITTIAVSIFSAFIQMKSQASGKGILILFSVVYLIAEIFALMLTLAALFISPLFPFGPEF
jgi:hypothetical protein